MIRRLSRYSMICLALGAASISCGAEPDRNPYTVLKQNCLQCRELRLEMDATEREERAARAQLCLEEIDKLTFEDTSPGAEVLAYFRATLMLMAGRDNDGLRELLPLFGRKTIAVEAVDAAQHLDRHRPRRMGEKSAVTGLGLEELAKRLAPTTPEGGIPAISCPDFRHDDDRRERVPALYGAEHPLFAIALLFKHMNLYKEAGVAYLEAAYAACPEDGAGNWCPGLAERYSPLWTGAARAEWLIGNNDDAAAYAAKAIIFGDLREKHMASSLLDQIAAGVAPPPLEPNPDSFSITEIAYRYAGMKMHPRAISLLREYRAIVGESADVLIEGYLKEWRELIGEVYARSRDYRFFEQDVTSDCAALRIPPPASEAALALSVRMAGWIAELIQ